MIHIFFLFSLNISTIHNYSIFAFKYFFSPFDVSIKKSSKRYAPKSESRSADIALQLRVLNYIKFVNLNIFIVCIYTCYHMMCSEIGLYKLFSNCNISHNIFSWLALRIGMHEKKKFNRVEFINL